MSDIIKIAVSSLKGADEVISSVNLSNYAKVEDIPSLEDYLDKSVDNVISGNLSVYGKDVAVMSGNFIQTDADVDVYGKQNVFIQADTNRSSYGRSSAGSKGFYVLSVIPPNKLKLSGQVDIPSSGYSKLWSVSLADKLDSQFSQISSVDGNIVAFVSPFDTLIQAKSVSSESQLTALIADDDNAFYCPSDASLGNAVMNFYGQHVEGGSVHAIAQYSHVEGRGSIAEGRYAHAEGNITTAGGAGSHAEGMYTRALGNRSHAEGERTIAYNIGAHAEGYYTSAENNYSHSEGVRTYAKGEASHAEGLNSFSKEYASHAEGYATSAIARYSHTEGLSSIASGLDSHAEGYGSIATGKGAHAEGGSQQVGTDVYPGGYASGEGAHAEGSATSAIGTFSHAEGYKTLAQGLQAHSEGIRTVASGNRSHAEGCETYATALYSHADGYQTSATAESSHASGKLAVANSTRQYVWNGTNSIYDPTAGSGTYCINPVNGISGFYIGSDNFVQCVLSAIQGMTDSQKVELKTALGV